MSRSIYNSTYRLGLYTFTPSYSLCILTSRHRVRCSSGLKQLAKHHSQVTYTPCKAPQKAVEGATALFVCLYSSSWMLSVRDKIWHVLTRSFSVLELDMHRTSLQSSRLNSSSFNCTRYVLDCTFSRTLRAMTSHLRANCNSALEHFAVRLIAHSAENTNC